MFTARFRTQQKANTELLLLWWRIRRTILDRQESQPWGSGVLVRLTDDLRAEFPSMKGFSRRNLMYMQAFARAWPATDAIVQQPVAQLPWSHVIVLLDKLDDQSVRDWYAARDAVYGWSRAVLIHQISTRLHHREAAASTNFVSRLEGRQSELAQQITKDPYTLDFLAIESDATERRVEERLVDRIVDTLHELGPGFAFVGRQFHFENDAVVRYALASSAQPIAVSRYELAPEDQAALPDEATIVGAFSRELARPPQNRAPDV